MNTGSDNHSTGDGELDDPIGLFASQEEPTSPDFVDKLRRRIHRRAASSQVVSFVWELPGVVAVEMAKVLSELVAAVGGKKEV